MKLLCAPWKAVSSWSHLFLVAWPPHIFSILCPVPAAGYFTGGRWLQRGIRHSSAIAIRHSSAIAIAICSSAKRAKAIKKASKRAVRVRVGGGEGSRGGRRCLSAICGWCLSAICVGRWGTDAPVYAAAPRRFAGDEAPTTAGMVVGVAAVVVDCLPIVSPHLPACAARGCHASWRRVEGSRAAIAAVGALGTRCVFSSWPAIVAITI